MVLPRRGGEGAGWEREGAGKERGARGGRCLALLDDLLDDALVLGLADVDLLCVGQEVVDALLLLCRLPLLARRLFLCRIARIAREFVPSIFANNLLFHMPHPPHRPTHNATT